MLAHDGADGVGGLVGVVEGDGGHVVVQDVGLDDAVQQLAADKAHLAVDGGGSASDKVPLLTGVVGEGRVGVLEEGDGNYKDQYVELLQDRWTDRLTEPVVDPEVRDKVPDGHVGPSKGAAEVVERGAGQGEANVAVDDEHGIAVLVQRAEGVEVVDAAASTVVLALAAALALALVVVVAGDVGQQVVGPSDELLHDQHEERVGGSILGELRQLVDQLAQTRGLLLAGSGHKDHVALHVAGGGVVLAVGDLPAEVGHQQRRVQHPARQVVEPLVVGKGAVAALVGNDPEAGAEEALQHRVQRPETGAEGLGGDQLGRDIVVEDVKGGGQAGHVAQDVGVALERRPLEAVLGDGVADVLDGEVGHLELVAVRVDHAAKVGLDGVDVDRGQGRERRGRGRRSGRVHGRNGRRGLGRVGDVAPLGLGRQRHGGGSHGWTWDEDVMRWR